MVVLRVAVGMCAIALLSCAAEEARMENRMENRLDLTLGGHNRSLRGDLSLIDEAHGSGPAVRPMPPRPVPDPFHVPEPDPPEPDPPPEPSRFREVTLQEGDTLWGLAETHLGAGKRWRELLRLNGWSEESASQLRAGTKVKVPRD